MQNTAASSTVTAFDDEAYQELCAKTEGTTINSQTLLATDYLNHFNEVVMLLEMIPDMPDMMSGGNGRGKKKYSVQAFKSK